jgi:hypothetical protein
VRFREGKPLPRYDSPHKVYELEILPEVPINAQTRHVEY